MFIGIARQHRPAFAGKPTGRQRPVAPAKQQAATMYKGGTAEERIARGIAPVKPEFLRAVQERTQVDVVTGSNAAAEPSEPPLKKSKNQQKRVRRRARSMHIYTLNPLPLAV